MSELVPDHLSVMRETLSRFCDEIRSFHADYGNGFSPSSPAVHEQSFICTPSIVGHRVVPGRAAH